MKNTSQSSQGKEVDSKFSYESETGFISGTEEIVVSRHSFCADNAEEFMRKMQDRSLTHGISSANAVITHAESDSENQAGRGSALGG